MKATVAICTYNGVNRIGAVLMGLARQSMPAEEWEVLVIDNASTDDTRGVAVSCINSQLGGRGRVVHEEQPGLSFARARAAQEARGEIICFLDDDNIPAPDFVASSIQAFAERPRAGVIGGKVLPRWATKPTALAETVAPFALAICDLGEEPRCIDDIGSGIIGAGLCVRRDLLRQVFGGMSLANMVTDRLGSSLISGGDLAISVVAMQSRWQCWYVPTLQIQHILPASRMEKQYLLRLYEGIGRGQAATRKCYDWKGRSPLAWFIGVKEYCRWCFGRFRGPSFKLKQQYPDLAGDLHELNQRQVWGRAMQSLHPFWL